MSKLAKVLALVLCLNLFGANVFAVGELDTTFNSTGRNYVSFNQPNVFVKDIAVQPDGKIVAVGEFFSGNGYVIAVVRLNTDGTLDTSFDGDGKVITDIGGLGSSANSVAVQPDGKIVVGGSAKNPLAFDFALARYNADGSLDTSFDSDGKITTQVGFFYSTIFSIAIQNDGKIVAAGNAIGDQMDFAVARYRTDGSLDASFGNNGILLTPISPESSDIATSVVVQNDGKIVVCGNSSDSVTDKLLTTFNFSVVRYNRNGSLDTNFDEDGKLIPSFGTTSEFADSVAIQMDGKLLFSGRSGSSGLLVRYNPDATLDTNLDNDGIINFANQSVGSQILQPDGKILYSWRFTNVSNPMYVTRLNSNGSVDNAFGEDGNTDHAAGELALQTDGKIVVGQTFNNSFLISRLTGDSPIPFAAEISGQIVNSQNRGIPNGRVTLTDLQTGEAKIATANYFGYFRFNRLPTDRTYQLIVSHKRYNFSESTQTIRLLGNLSGLVISGN